MVSCRRRYGQFVIPGLVPGIHPTTGSGVCCELDPGNKCRDDIVRSVEVRTLGRPHHRSFMPAKTARPVPGSYKGESDLAKSMMLTLAM
jgi:hypothetical protein